VRECKEGGEEERGQCRVEWAGRTWKHKAQEKSEMRNTSMNAQMPDDRQTDGVDEGIYHVRVCFRDLHENRVA
jgi:hypothetical protein